MATLPTPEEKARMVLSIYKHFGTRPGEVLRGNNFLGVHSQLGLRWEDVKDGLVEAGNLGWIENGPYESIKLTAAGFAEI